MKNMRPVSSRTIFRSSVYYTIHSHSYPSSNSIFMHSYAVHLASAAKQGIEETKLSVYILGFQILIL
jgi:hypothetical protein